MTQPVMILDQHFRKVDELFDTATFARLGERVRIEGGADHPMDPARLDDLLPDAEILVAARPQLTRAMLDAAPKLRAVIEVSGAFGAGVDYAACFERGIEVLSCAPGFRQAVAEMGLAMLLAAGRGLVAEHEAFRAGRETWLDDREATDFTLYRQKIGFVGYGNIARELHRLLVPFDPQVAAFDPWLTDLPSGVTPLSLEAVFRTCRAVLVTAVPTAENRAMVGAAEIDSMARGSALVVLSRAHVLDYDAAHRAAAEGRITFATDVFPSEPLPADHPSRRAPNTIFSPHRAAAVPGGRQLIGRMILHDVEAMLDGRADRLLLRADPDKVDGLVAAQADIARAGKLPTT